MPKVQSTSAERRCYLAYLTANDRPRYQADYLNFLNMTRRHPGVDRVYLYLAISRVRPFAVVDRVAVDRLMKMALDCPWIEPRCVFWKGNVGRDFSSAQACLTAIGQDASDDDYVMVRNRSAYGPSRSSWFAEYIGQYERFDDSGLVGSTINLGGHPLRPSEGPTMHVQTYAYLSQWRHFGPLVDAYPAARCTDRLQLIVDGEIGLSRTMLEGGLSLSCLAWPEERFRLAQPDAPHVPRTDIKATMTSLSLRYKYRRYFWRPSDSLGQLRWWYALSVAPFTRSPTSLVKNLHLDQYDERDAR